MHWQTLHFRKGPSQLEGEFIGGETPEETECPGRVVRCSDEAP